MNERKRQFDNYTLWSAICNVIICWEICELKRSKISWRAIVIARVLRRNGKAFRAQKRVGKKPT